MKPEEIRAGGVYFNRIGRQLVKHRVLSVFAVDGVSMVAYESELKEGEQLTSQLINFAAQMQGEYL